MFLVSISSAAADVRSKNEQNVERKRNIDIRIRHQRTIVITKKSKKRRGAIERNAATFAQELVIGYLRV